MTDCLLLDQEIVKEIEWTGDPEQYDLALKRAGPKGLPFLVQNPWVADSRPFYFIDNIPETDTCIVWNYQGEWQAKYFPAKWRPEQGYTSIEIEIPQFVWRKNPDMDRAMTFEEDVFGSFLPDSWQAQHELVWYIDPRFNPLEDKVWAISCKPIGRPTLGIMDMGYVTPQVEVEYNKDLPVLDLDLDTMMPAYWELQNICAYRLDSAYETDQTLWVVKISPQYRVAKTWHWLGEITPVLKYTYNKDLPKLNLQIEDDLKWYDLFYEHVWYLDRKFLQDGQDDVWLVKVRATSHVLGDKHRDYISPVLCLEQNPDLGPVSFKVDTEIKFHDFAYRHIYYLEQSHCANIEDPIWAVRFSYTDKPQGDKHIDYVSPRVKVKINPNLKNLNFDYDIRSIPYHDFQYRHLLYLDHRIQSEYDMWALEISFTDRVKGDKDLGYITPEYRIEYNPDIKNVQFTVDYDIRYYDRDYLHIWYLKQNDQLIWLARSSIAKRIKGDITVDVVEPLLPEHLDVIFISYNEPNAEQNWRRVLEFAPWAKRVQGVQGIDRAHQAAAKLSATDIFYVVDADAYLIDDWTFDYQPDIFQREHTHIWRSQNPFNDLVYGYGGVKLMSRTKILENKTWRTLDYSTTVNADVKVMDAVSNISLFNTDKFSTWRSAFRECIKLCSQGNVDYVNKWATKKDVEFFQYAVYGVLDAIDFFKENQSKPKILQQINDRAWLEKEYNVRYKLRKNTKSNTNNKRRKS